MIQAKNLVKRFGEVIAVNDVSIDLGEGHSVTVFGPSGSGKTTLLRLIAGLTLPDAGQVIIDDTLMSEPGRAIPPHKRGIGFVFQTSALWPHMTVSENILFGLHGLTKREAHERLLEMISRTDLEGLEGRYPAELSGGESRRVSLARALAPKPRILLLDEPLTNVDPDLKSGLLDLVKKTVMKERITLLYVTHDRAEAEEIAGEDQLEMRAGRLGS